MSEQQRIVVEEHEPTTDVDEAPFEFRHVNIRKDKWFNDEFKIIDFLGRGKFGEVQRCVETSSGREFAAKFICTPRPQDRSDVEHEINMMRKLRHRRLVQLYEAFEAKKEMCLVLEIIYGGELFDRVVSDDFLLTERASVCLLRQICEGVDYIHSMNIIHLDLKPENILCLSKSGNRIKIIDFGLAREFSPKGDIRVMFGTPEFMAPEVVQYDPIDFSTDMWSVGVISYVLLSGLSPFMGDTDTETLSNVSRGKYDFGFTEFERVSPEAKDFISKLLIVDKKKRMTAGQCLEHSWLQKNNLNSSVAAIDKTQMKRFVSRRKWQKAINVLIALRRMGWNLKKLHNSTVNCQTDANCRTSKGRGVWNNNNNNNNNHAGKTDVDVKGTLRKTPEPQVRTKILTKVKVKAVEAQFPLPATNNLNLSPSDNTSQPSRTDGILTAPATSNAATTTTPTTNTTTPSPPASSSSAEKSGQGKKCRKTSAEHSTPGGNGHVFNLAKVVAHRPRPVKTSPFDFDAAWNSKKKNQTMTTPVTSHPEGAKRSADGLPAPEVAAASVLNRKCVIAAAAAPSDVTTVASGSSEPPPKNVERPRRNLMIREKIRFFNQIDEIETNTFAKKNAFHLTNKSS